jgi:predicted RNA-binding protein with TRAM domain
MMRGGNRGGPRGYQGGGQEMTPPVKEGDEIEVKIDAIGEKGDGIAKVNGFVLFVPGVKENENVKVRVTKVLRRVGFAEVVGRGTGQAEQAAAVEPEAEPEESEDFGEENKEESEEDLEGLELPQEEEDSTQSEEE